MRVRFFIVVWTGLVLACTSIKPLALSSSDGGKTVEMVQGQELVLTLESNHAPGYRWWLADSSRVVVMLPTERPSYQSKPPDERALGAAGVETWRFKAAQVGKQTLLFEYKRSFDEKEPPAKTVSYRVVVVK